MNTFFSLEDYREELTPFLESLDIIKDEAKKAERIMFNVDVHNEDTTWRFAPILVEKDDRGERTLASQKETRELCPFTTKLIKENPEIRACGFSTLKAGGTILPHMHSNALVTCMLPLTSNEETYIISDGEKRPIKEGEFTIFDYRPLHEVHNKGATDRVALLVLLDIKDRRKLWVG